MWFSRFIAGGCIQLWSRAVLHSEIERQRDDNEIGVIVYRSLPGRVQLINNVGSLHTLNIHKVTVEFGCGLDI
jgi:hypothetical protein